MNKPTAEQLAEVCANWWAKELCGEIEDPAITLKFAQCLKSNFEPIIRYNIQSGLGFLIDIYWQQTNPILDAADKSGITDEIKDALESFVGTSMYANQKQIFTCFQGYFPGKKVIWTQGDPLPVIQMNKPFFACMVRLCETDLGTTAIINGPVKEEFIFMVDNKLMLGGLDPITHREIAVNELIETLKGWKPA